MIQWFQVIDKSRSLNFSMVSFVLNVSYVTLFVLRLTKICHSKKRIIVVRSCCVCQRKSSNPRNSVYCGGLRALIPCCLVGLWCADRGVTESRALALSMLEKAHSAGVTPRTAPTRGMGVNGKSADSSVCR